MACAVEGKSESGLWERDESVARAVRREWRSVGYDVRKGKMESMGQRQEAVGGMAGFAGNGICGGNVSV